MEKLRSFHSLTLNDRMQNQTECGARTPVTIEIFLAAAIATSAPQAVDGDTFDIGSERVRIANIDAPETKSAKCDAERRLGEVAKRRLQELLSSPGFEMERGDPKSGRMKDRYGRTLATIYVDGIDVGSILINEGLARPWRGKREPWCN